MRSAQRTKYVIPRPRNLYNFGVALFVAVGSLCCGYASSISAALIGQLLWYDYMHLAEETSHTNAILGAVNGVYAAGGAFGCAFNMWSSEYFGRKRSIQIGCIISIVGAAIMTRSFFLPYSPRWLLSQDHLNEAWIVTERLHASKNDPTDSYEQARYRQMSAQIEFERNHNAVGMFVASLD